MIKGHGDDIYNYPDIRINFSSNINQHPDHSALSAHLASRVDLIAHYPEPEAWSLERMLAERLGIALGNVLVTCGVTEAIYLVAQAFPYRHYISQPTFREYGDATKLFATNTDYTKRAFWVCTPNNPDGRVIDEKRLRNRASNYDLVVVDQSYEHQTDVPQLSAKSAVKLGNVIQLHSFTKTYAVPGLRVGYVVAAAPIIRSLRTYLRPWSVSSLSVEAAKWLLEHGQPIAPDLAEARRLAAQLNGIEGIKVEPSQTTFMLCHIRQSTATLLKRYLAEQHGMLIRDCQNFAELSNHHFRVCAQRPEENDALVAAIWQFVASETHQ